MAPCADIFLFSIPSWYAVAACGRGQKHSFGYRVTGRTTRTSPAWCALGRRRKRLKMTDREPDAQFRDDIATLLQIVEGLDRLEAAMYHARSSIPARQRGYFTPDEDDRLRQMLLAYRNYRISAYEIIDRCREYEAVGSLPSQLRTFILGFAAALTVYSKSQKLIETFRNEPLARRSLNEPEPDFGLDADFFERIFERYTSFQNYATMVAAERFWRRHRRAVRELGIEQEPEIGQLCELIQHRRSAIHRRFHRVVGDRVVHRMQRLRELLLRPA